MLRKLSGLLIIFLFFSGALKPSHPEIMTAQGEILRFYETRANDWSSYILIRDSFNREFKFQVHPKITAIRRGSQIEDVGQLTGGMKVTVIYRILKDEMRASVIRIGGAIRV